MIEHPTRICRIAFELDPESSGDSAEVKGFIPIPLTWSISLKPARGALSTSTRSMRLRRPCRFHPQRIRKAAIHARTTPQTGFLPKLAARIRECGAQPSRGVGLCIVARHSLGVLPCRRLLPQTKLRKVQEQLARRTATAGRHGAAHSPHGSEHRTFRPLPRRTAARFSRGGCSRFPVVWKHVAIQSSPDAGKGKQLTEFRAGRSRQYFLERTPVRIKV